MLSRLQRFSNFLMAVVGLQAQAGKDLIGKWKNELGSAFIIESVDALGNVQGKYQSAKGEAEGFYNLTGKSEPGILERNTGRPIGFTVVWKNKKMDAQSVTTWSGLFFSLPAKDVIIANWLLTVTIKDYADAWEATLVGQDRFVKRKCYLLEP